MDLDAERGKALSDELGGAVLLEGGLGMGVNVLPPGGELGMEVGDAATAAGMKTLIITGFAFQLPRDELGRFEYLLKPVRPNELVRAIERALDASPSTRAPQ